VRQAPRVFDGMAALFVALGLVFGFIRTSRTTCIVTVH
jgi:hypothetical protein